METRGQRLKRLRRELNLSQSELATRVKSTRSSISMYECDDRWPDFETLDNLAEVFNASFDYLLCKTNVNTGYPGHFLLAQDPHTIMTGIEKRAAAYFQGITSWQQQLLKAYDNASHDTQAAVNAILHIGGNNGDR